MKMRREDFTTFMEYENQPGRMDQGFNIFDD
jgi:hypothetical protein